MYAVNFRYIELELELSPGTGSTTRQAVITAVAIAGDKRHIVRHDANETLHLHSITMSAVLEQREAITGSMPFKILLPHVERDLEHFDYRRIMSIGDQDMPPEMEFVRKTGVMLRIRDLANTADYFSSNVRFLYRPARTLRAS